MSETEGSVSLEQRIKELLLEDKNLWVTQVLIQKKPSPQALVILPESVLTINQNVDKEVKKYVALVNEELQSLREQLAVCDVCCKQRLTELQKAEVKIYDLERQLREKSTHIGHLEVELSEANKDLDIFVDKRAELLERLELLKVSDHKNAWRVVMLEGELMELKEHCITTSEYITDTETAIDEAIKILARTKEES